jgi:hypothetical protein
MRQESNTTAVTRAYLSKQSTQYLEEEALRKVSKQNLHFWHILCALHVHNLHVIVVVIPLRE